MSFRAIPAFVQLLNAVAANFGAALAMTWPWLLLLVLLHFAFSSSGGWTGQLLHAALSLLAFASIGVTWQRFLLRGERAEGFALLRLDPTVWHYAGIVVVLCIPAFLLGMLISVPVMLVAAALGAVSEEGGFDLALELCVLLSMVLPLAIFQRLGIKLPALALGKAEYGFGDAWRDSRGFFLPIIGFSLLLGALTYFPTVGLMTLTSGDEPGIFGTALRALLHGAWTWLGTILATSALTILYAVLIEKADV